MKVLQMQMNNYNFDEFDEKMDPMNDNLTEDSDLVMEQILENINHTPLGQVLKRIATLPEVRREKVLNVRQQITQGQYETNDRLDLIVDKVLEDLIA